MAESPSSASRAETEWLPALGGARLLRLAWPGGEPGTLILRTAAGTEHRLEAGTRARFGRHIEYVVPAGLSWLAAFLEWPDGTRAAVPAPPPRAPEAHAGGAVERGLRRLGAPHRAEVIELRARRPSPGAPSSPSVPERRDPRPAPPAPESPPSTLPGPERRDPRPARPETESAPSTLPGDERRDPRPARPETESPPTGAAPGAWSAPPRAPSHADAPVRAELARALSARDSLQTALSAARADLRAARAARAADASTVATLSAELDAERTAHRVTRGTLATLTEALTAARASSARGAPTAMPANAPAGLEHHARAQAEAAAAVARAPRQETGRLLSDLEAAAAALRATAAMRDAADQRSDTAPTDAPLAPTVDHGEAERRLLAAPPAPTVDRGGAEPHAIAASSDPPAVVALAPSGTEPRAGAAAAYHLVADSPSGSALPVVASPQAGVSVGSPWLLGKSSKSAAKIAPARRLRRALVELASQDPVAGGALLAALLPAQGALLGDELTYDLTIRGAGTFAIAAHDGTTDVRPLARPRGRKHAAFHLQADPQALGELLAGERRRPRRFGRAARLSGRRARFDQLHEALTATRLSLADAVKAGARLDPRLVYRVLPFAIPPEWTCGHVFTVQSQIAELAPRAWYVIARDGVPLTVVEHVAGAAADATVTMTRATFDRLLRGEPSGGGELPVIRGDRTAVAALKRWIDEASGAVG
ncbi:MAG TPA: hypothetical protein VFG79_05805 [Solirubrobacter sp.]|nr:hypothetical protein [Solirubrobacter sp.]